MLTRLKLFLCTMLILPVMLTGCSQSKSAPQTYEDYFDALADKINTDGGKFGESLNDYDITLTATDDKITVTNYRDMGGVIKYNQMELIIYRDNETEADYILTAEYLYDYAGKQELKGTIVKSEFDDDYEVTSTSYSDPNNLDTKGVVGREGLEDNANSDISTNLHVLSIIMEEQYELSFNVDSLGFTSWSDSNGLEIYQK